MDNKYKSNQGNCRDCGQRLIWMETYSGKKIPVDMKQEHVEDKVFDRKKHSCHFDTCESRKKGTDLPF